MRPNEISQDHSTDFDWLNWIFDYYARVDVQYDNFAILRPTSPFRTSETIKRAYLEFYSNPHCDSLRAVEKCKQHPGKMWKIYNDFMVPILPYTNETTPWHSCPYSTLPEIYVQNACIEISKVSSFIENKSISGNKIFPFITHNFEGMDINYEDDWDYIEHLIFKNPSLLEYIN
jgi:N-acylneuraminate cytidylyltransferase